MDLGSALKILGLFGLDSSAGKSFPRSFKKIFDFFFKTVIVKHSFQKFEKNVIIMPEVGYKFPIYFVLFRLHNSNDDIFHMFLVYQHIDLQS